MSTLTEFLFPAPATRTPGAIIRWWERRRPAYNAWVGTAGLVSLATVTLVTTLRGGSAAVPGLLFGAVVFGAMANVCYLLGPATEILLAKVWGRQILPVGPALFRMGLTFSVGLALFPTLLVGILVAVRVVLWMLGVG